jgi:hypothetical protein
MTDYKIVLPECDLENKHIIKDVYKCQKRCSYFKPQIHYFEKDRDQIALSFLDEYNKCFTRCNDLDKEFEILLIKVQVNFYPF